MLPCANNLLAPFNCLEFPGSLCACTITNKLYVHYLEKRNCAAYTTFAATAFCLIKYRTATSSFSDGINSNGTASRTVLVCMRRGKKKNLTYVSYRYIVQGLVRSHNAALVLHGDRIEIAVRLNNPPILTELVSLARSANTGHCGN